jgi:hypothetical protein
MPITQEIPTASPIDYRQTEQPAVLPEPWRLPNSGAQDAAETLAAAFKDFSKTASGYVDQIQTKRGAQAGAAAGASGNPNYQTGAGQFTAYAQAYNNAATRSYAIQAEATAEDTASRLQVEAANDPSHFATTYAAARDAVLKEAPPQAKQVLADMYNRRLAEGVSALSHSQATEIQQKQRIDLSEGVARQTDRVAQLQAAGDPASLAQAEEEHVRLNLLIDGAKNTGTISQAEAGAMRQDSLRQVTAQTVQAQFSKVLRDPKGDPVGFIQKFEDLNTTANPAVPADERQKITQSLFTALRENNALNSMDNKNGKTEEQLRFEAGDTQATHLLLSGGLTDRVIDQMVTTNQLKPERATSLHEMLKHGDEPKSDPKKLFDVRNDPGFVDMKPADIAALPGINWEDKEKLVDEATKRQQGWEGTQEVKEAHRRINAALGILPGVMREALTPAEQRASQTAFTNFYNEMSKLPESQRASNALTISGKVIQASIHQDQIENVATQQKRLQVFLKTHGASPDDSDYGSKQWQASYDAIQANIKRAQAAANGAGAQ